jgi:hypothetical protein
LRGRGTSLHGGSFYLSFHQKWSKLGTLLQTDANEAEIKKKNKNFLQCTHLYVGPSFFTVHFAEKRLNIGYWCETMLELRLNITESKILHSYENNENTKNKIYISNSALLKVFKVDCYLHCKNTKVKALQLFNAARRRNATKDKIALIYSMRRVETGERPSLLLIRQDV